LITFGELPRARREHHDRPVVCITFDDGNLGNYEYAFPLLKRWQVPATFFLTAGFVDRDPVVVQRFCDFYNAPSGTMEALHWRHAEEMVAGGMEIGAHTYSHPNLAKQSADEVRWEVEFSREMIQQKLGLAVETMAYPFGLPVMHFNGSVERIVETAGYRGAAAVLYRGVRPGDSPFAIPRFFVNGDSLEELRAKVFGLFDFMALWQTRVPRSLARLFTPDYFASGDLLHPHVGEWQTRSTWNSPHMRALRGLSLPRPPQ
jgi:peptidoglycan/xylan/chitin deacetylase (PgdA/CDA1 family)